MFSLLCVVKMHRWAVLPLFSLLFWLRGILLFVLTYFGVLVLICRLGCFFLPQKFIVCRLSKFIFILSVQLIISPAVLCRYLELEVWYLECVIMVVSSEYDNIFYLVFFGLFAVDMWYNAGDSRIPCDPPAEIVFLHEISRPIPTWNVLPVMILFVDCVILCPISRKGILYIRP